MRDDGRDLTQVLVEFAQLLVVDHSVQQVLDRLGAYCTELLPVDGIGVLITPDGDLAVATANTPQGRIVEQLEVELGEGPCTDAVRTGEQILLPDLEAATGRYPRFAPRALDAGVRSIHALPMVARGDVVGSLDAVAWTPTQLSAEQLAAAQTLADVGFAYLVNSRIRVDHSELAQQLQAALDSRVVIEQAKGKLAERHGESVDAAFDRLRRHARSRQQKLRAVAAQVLSGDLTI